MQNAQELPGCFGRVRQAWGKKECFLSTVTSGCKTA
jgi:hypothetical protein